MDDGQKALNVSKWTAANNLKFGVKKTNDLEASYAALSSNIDFLRVGNNSGIDCFPL